MAPISLFSLAAICFRDNTIETLPCILLETRRGFEQILIGLLHAILFLECNVKIPLRKWLGGKKTHCNASDRLHVLKIVVSVSIIFGWNISGFELFRNVNFVTFIGACNLRLYLFQHITLLPHVVHYILYMFGILFFETPCVSYFYFSSFQEMNSRFYFLEKRLYKSYCFLRWNFW